MISHKKSLTQKRPKSMNNLYRTKSIKSIKSKLSIKRGKSMPSLKRSSLKRSLPLHVTHNSIIINKITNQIKNDIELCSTGECLQNNNANFYSTGTSFIYTIASSKSMYTVINKSHPHGDWTKKLSNVKGIILFKNLHIEDDLKGKGIMSTIFSNIEKICDEKQFLIIISSFQNDALAKNFHVKRGYDLYNQENKITDLRELTRFIEFMSNKPTIMQIITSKGKFNMTKIPNYAVRLPVSNKSSKYTKKSSQYGNILL